MAGLGKWIGNTYFDVIGALLRDGDSMVIGLDLSDLEGRKLSDIIEDNTSLTNLRDNVFFTIGAQVTQVTFWTSSVAVRGAAKAAPVRAKAATVTTVRNRVFISGLLG